MQNEKQPIKTIEEIEKEVLGHENAFQQSMGMAVFKGNYKTKFGFTKEIHRVKFTSNKINDTYEMEAWGADKDTPVNMEINRKAVPLKLSENGDFADLFNSQVKKYIQADEINLSYTTMNFETGAIETEIYYIRDGHKNRIHLHQDKAGVVTKLKRK